MKDLNTSHVNVQSWKSKLQIVQKQNLNTSHVNVQCKGNKIFGGMITI